MKWKPNVEASPSRQPRPATDMVLLANMALPCRTTLTAACILGWSGFVVSLVETAFGWLSAIPALAMIGGLLLSTFVALVLCFAGRWRPLLYCAFGFLAYFGGLLVARKISEYQRLKSMEAAHPLIAAAEQFHSVTGSYPASVDALIPQYLARAPWSKMGVIGTKIFLCSDEKGFRVSFTLPRWHYCLYDSTTESWEVSD